MANAYKRVLGTASPPMVVDKQSCLQIVNSEVLAPVTRCSMTKIITRVASRVARAKGYGTETNRTTSPLPPPLSSLVVVM